MHMEDEYINNLSSIDEKHDKVLKGYEDRELRLSLAGLDDNKPNFERHVTTCRRSHKHTDSANTVITRRFDSTGRDDSRRDNDNRVRIGNSNNNNRTPSRKENQPNTKEKASGGKGSKRKKIPHGKHDRNIDPTITTTTTTSTKQRDPFKDRINDLERVIDKQDKDMKSIIKNITKDRKDIILLNEKLKASQRGEILVEELELKLKTMEDNEIILLNRLAEQEDLAKQALKELLMIQNENCENERKLKIYYEDYYKREYEEKIKRIENEKEKLNKEMKALDVEKNLEKAKECMKFSQEKAVMSSQISQKNLEIDRLKSEIKELKSIILDNEKKTIQELKSLKQSINILTEENIKLRANAGVGIDENGDDFCYDSVGVNNMLDGHGITHKTSGGTALGLRGSNSAGMISSLSNVNGGSGASAGNGSRANTNNYASGNSDTGEGDNQEGGDTVWRKRMAELEMTMRQKDAIMKERESLYKNQIEQITRKVLALQGELDRIIEFEEQNDYLKKEITRKNEEIMKLRTHYKQKLMKKKELMQENTRKWENMYNQLLNDMQYLKAECEYSQRYQSGEKVETKLSL